MSQKQDDYFANLAKNLSEKGSAAEAEPTGAAETGETEKKGEPYFHPLSQTPSGARSEEGGGWSSYQKTVVVMLGILITLVAIFTFKYISFANSWM